MLLESLLLVFRFHNGAIYVGARMDSLHVEEDALPGRKLLSTSGGWGLEPSKQPHQTENLPDWCHRRRLCHRDCRSDPKRRQRSDGQHQNVDGGVEDQDGNTGSAQSGRVRPGRKQGCPGPVLRCNQDEQKRRDGHRAKRTMEKQLSWGSPTSQATIRSRTRRVLSLASTMSVT